MQLSWPEDGDRRRGRTPYRKVADQTDCSELAGNDASRYNPIAFLHSAIGDIKAYHGLLRKEVLAMDLNCDLTILREPSLQYMNGSNEEESSLLAYCKYSIYGLSRPHPNV